MRLRADLSASIRREGLLVPIGHFIMAGMDDQKERKRKIAITGLIVGLLATAINLGHLLEQASTTTLGIVALTLSAVAVVCFLVVLIMIVWRSDA